MHWPTACGCGHVFAEGELVGDGEPVRHQVEELPPIGGHGDRASVPARALPGLRRAHARRAARRCGGQRVRAALSRRGRGAVGPQPHLAPRRRRAAASSCSARRISTGTVDAILDRVADALDEPDDGSARARPRGQARSTWTRPAGGPPASGARCGARSPTVTPCCAIAADRHEDHANDAAGRHHRDRHLRSLVGLHATCRSRRRQVCWAHLRRDFNAHAEGLAAEKEFGEHGPADLRRAVLGLGDLPAHRRPPRPAARGSGRCAASSSRSCAPTPASSRATGTRAGWPATCSRSGRRSGRSPTTAASSRPTTTPNARCAAPSSTASCQPRQPVRATASDASNGSSRSTPPAACSAAPLHAYLIDALAAHTRGDPVPAARLTPPAH